MPTPPPMTTPSQTLTCGMLSESCAAIAVVQPILLPEEVSREEAPPSLPVIAFLLPPGQVDRLDVASGAEDGPGSAAPGLARPALDQGGAHGWIGLEGGQRVVHASDHDHRQSVERLGLVELDHAEVDRTGWEQIDRHLREGVAGCLHSPRVWLRNEWEVGGGRETKTRNIDPDPGV